MKNLSKEYNEFKYLCTSLGSLKLEGMQGRKNKFANKILYIN